MLLGKLAQLDLNLSLSPFSLLAATISGSVKMLEKMNK